MQLPWRRLIAPADSLYERNARNVMIDGIGVGLVNGIGTFLSVFLVRLNAPNLLVGLLTSLPAIVGALLALPIGQFLQGQRNLIAWYSRSRLWVLSSYALIGLVPFFAGVYTPRVILLIWAIASVPQVIVNVTFTLVMSAVAGPSKRIQLMSRRWTTLGITNAVSVASAGFLLDRIRFPLNYQVVFIGSFIGGCISYMYSTSIVLPPNEETVAPAQPWYHSWRGMGRLVRENRRFTQFVTAQFVFRFGLSLVIPLLPLYYVRVVSATDSQIGIISTIGSAVLLLAYTFWSYISRRRGERFVLLICCFGLVLYPLAVSLTQSIILLPILAGFAGIFIAGIDLVLFDLLMASCPTDQRGPAVGLYHTTLYIALFAAPLLATSAAAYWSLATLLAVASVIRFVSLLLFAIFGVGREEHAERPIAAPSVARSR